MAAGWSDLPTHVLALIAARLPTVGMGADYFRFRAVCSSWRLAAEEVSLPYLKHPFLALILPGDDPDSNFRSLYFPSDDQVYRNLLPISHCLECYGSHRGWVVIEDYSTLQIYLLNPLSRARINLPDLSSLERMVIDINESFSLDDIISSKRKAAVSCHPSSSSAADEMVVLLANERYYGLAFARPGDDSWTAIIDGEKGRDCYDDVISYRGEFYAVNEEGSLYVCDLNSPRASARKLILDELRDYESNWYLVESSSGGLLQIRRYSCFLSDSDDSCPSKRDYGTNSFQVYRIDLRENRRVEVWSLGDDALFLGINTSFCVPAAEFPGIRRNSIYYTGFCMSCQEQDVGVFDFDSRTFDRRYSPEGVRVEPPPLWFMS